MSQSVAFTLGGCGSPWEVAHNHLQLPPRQRRRITRIRRTTTRCTIGTVLQPLPLFHRQLLNWYHRHRRDLPWRPVVGSRRGSLPDAYHVLVSELMLQQTQVSTVIPYFHRFIKRFPTIIDLAGADEQEVLRLWQGLGYYSRARNLHETARRVVRDHNAKLPVDLPSLLKLPGIGRYTAGAVASIAFGQVAPILDGNVIRVLCRLDKIATDPRTPAALAALWTRAEQIVPANHPGDFNSAMMELGALVCMPRAPQCLICPVRAQCEAHAAGVQETIPPPKARKPTPLHRRWTFCIRRRGPGDTAAANTGAATRISPADEWLIEQRPAKGRWAGMWQFISIEAGDGIPTSRQVASLLPMKVRAIQPLGTISHALTHRRYIFDAFRCEAVVTDAAFAVEPLRRWVSLTQLDAFPLSRPQVRIAELLRGGAPDTPAYRARGNKKEPTP